jgi:hypothetical protein
MDDPVDGPARPRARARRWWRELVLAAGLYACYDAIRGLIRGGSAQAQRDGWDVLNLERVLHLDPEGWINTHVQSLPILAVPACYVYATLHFVVTPCVLVWTFRQRPLVYGQARTCLAITTAGALLGFWLFPTAPPRLLSGGGFHDTLAAYSSWGWWGSDASVPQGAVALANQFAAMPSLHVAWSAWCAATLLAQVRHPIIRALAALYPLLTAAVVLATGNHYVLDVIAGVALWGLADAVSRTHANRLTRAPSAAFE